jgi:hypothetical protein
LGRTKIASVVGPRESESLGYLEKTEIELRVDTRKYVAG